MISINDQRVLVYDDSADSFLDITKDVNRWHEGAQTITLEANDAIYVGSFLPFSNMYFEVSVANPDPADLIFEYWDGATWRATVDQIDFTKASGATLSNSGMVHIFPDDQYTWSYVERTTDVADLTEFAMGPEIYKKYWTRIRSSAVITFGLSYIGTLLCSEDELLAEYPQFDSINLKSAWESGKTDWLEQRVIASEYIVQDLKKRSLISDRSQMIETSIYKPGAVHKTAQIVYNGLGARTYPEEISRASEAYKDAMNLNHFEVDMNANAIKERSEQSVSIRRGSR